MELIDGVRKAYQRFVKSNKKFTVSTIKPSNEPSNKSFTKSPNKVYIIGHKIGCRGIYIYDKKNIKLIESKIQNSIILYKFELRNGNDKFMVKFISDDNITIYMDGYSEFDKFIQNVIVQPHAVTLFET